MQNGTGRVLKKCAAILLLWLGGFGVASAIIIRGHADPNFDGTGVFAGDVWTAVVQFSDADSSCVSGGNSNDPSGHVCTPDPGSLTVTGTLSDGVNSVNLNFLFTGPAPSISIQTSAGVATAVKTGLVGASDQFTLGSNTGFAWIDFEYGVATISLQDCDLLLPRITFFNTNTDDEDDWDDCTVCTANINSASKSSPDTVIVEQFAPEPGILWLVLGALSAGWLVRRRRQAL